MAIEIFCERGIVFSLCAMIFTLPVSIALLESFAALAIFLYLVKKINRILIDWPAKASDLNFQGKICFVWKGFCPVENYLNRPLQFLTLAVFLSVVLSQYPGTSLVAFIGKFLKGIFLYFCFLEVIRNEKRVRLFLIFLLLSAVMTSLSGVVQHYTGKDFLKGRVVGTENFVSTHRISSSFFGANGFGAYLLPVIGLVVHFLYSALARRKTWIWAGILALVLTLLLTCLCWTYSRSSWVGYLLILFVMAFLDQRKIWYSSILLVIFIFTFMPSLNSVRQMNLISDNKNGLQNAENLKSVLRQGGSGRYAFWKKAISIIETSPIYGTGLNTYSKIVRRDPDPRTWWYAHNCYLQLTAETGFVGLICFLWMLAVLFWQGVKCCSQIKDIWVLTCLQGIVCGLFGFLAQSFFDNTFYTVQLGVFMWLLFGLMVAVTKLNPR